MLLTRGRRARRVAVIATAVAIVTVGTTVAAQATSSLKKGLTVFYIPKDTLNPYEVIADRGGKIALTQMGSKQVVQSGTKDTAAAQLPAVQTAIQTGANAIVIAGNDPAALCPQLKQAMAKGVAVVTFDSDTNCRQLFINQADTETIGRSQIQELGKEMGYKGEFAILSAASTATNQNAWIKYMKLELKLPKYKNMKLVKIYYGNDDPAESLQATESMLQAYPNLKGIESPTTVGISSAAQYLSNSKYKGKVVLQGLGLREKTDVNARWQREMAPFFEARRPAARRGLALLDEIFHLLTPASPARPPPLPPTSRCSSSTTQARASEPCRLSWTAGSSCAAARRTRSCENGAGNRRSSRSSPASTGPIRRC